MKITFTEGRKAEGLYFPRSKKSTWYVNRTNLMGKTNGWWHKKLNRMEIQVAKQRNIFKTIRVLLHELGHVFIALFLNNKYHRKWDKEKQIEEYKNRRQNTN